MQAVAFKLDTKNVEAEMLVRQDPLFLKERDALLDLIDRAQRANSPEDYVELHARLLARYAARQSVREERRDHRDGEKSALRELTSRQPKPLDDIRRLQGREAIRQARMYVTRSCCTSFGRSPTRWCGACSVTTGVP